MKQITAEWVAKAEADFATMERECQVTDNPNCDGICFHAQQCAEKYPKASLCEAGVSFGKIHDLVALLEYVLELEPSWEQFREDLAYLSAFAVSYRYPGDAADRDCALDGQQRCRVFRRAARKSLGLET
jgi:HEPN domain-containing protein